MPPAPEVPYTACKIRRIKILHQLESHNFRRTDGNKRVTPKITVNLQRKENRSQNQFRASIHTVIIKNRIDKDRRPVSDHHLHKKTPYHQNRSRGHSSGIPQLYFRNILHLRQKILRPFNRARHKLRKKGHEQRITNQIRLRPDVSPVNVNRISKRLKSVERDPPPEAGNKIFDQQSPYAEAPTPYPVKQSENYRI